MGTLGYMSPEQVKGRPADPRSDIFAFGAILYEMLSGQRAFHRESAAETMSAILREEPPDLSATNKNVQPGLERIVRHCLEKSPEERFHSAHDLAFDLQALSGTTGSAAVAASPERVSRKRPLAIAGALLALAAAVAAGYFLGKSKGVSAPPTFKQLTFRHGAIWGARLRVRRQERPAHRRLGREARADLLRRGPTARRPRPSVSPTPTSRPCPRRERSRSSCGRTSTRHSPASARSRASRRRAAHRGRCWRAFSTPTGLPTARTSRSRGWSAASVGSSCRSARCCTKRRDGSASPGSRRAATASRSWTIRSSTTTAARSRSWISPARRRRSRRSMRAAFGLAWSPDGSEVWYTAAEVGGNRALYRLDALG